VRSRGEVEELVSLSEDKDEEYLDYVLPDFNKASSKAGSEKSRSVDSDPCLDSQTQDAGNAFADQQNPGQEIYEGSRTDRVDQEFAEQDSSVDLLESAPLGSPLDDEDFSQLVVNQPLVQESDPRELDHKQILSQGLGPDSVSIDTQQSGIELENGVDSTITLDPPIQQPSRQFSTMDPAHCRTNLTNPMMPEVGDAPFIGPEDDDFEQSTEGYFESAHEGNPLGSGFEDTLPPGGESAPITDADENEESQLDSFQDPVCLEDLSVPDREWGLDCLIVPVEAEDVVPYEGKIDEEDRLVSLVGEFYSKCRWIESLSSSQGVLLEVLAGSGNPSNTLRHLRKEFASEYQGLEMVRIAWFLRCELPEFGDPMPSWAKCRRLLDLFESIPGPEDLLSIVVLAADRSMELSNKRCWYRKVTVPKPGAGRCYVPMSGVDFILRFWDLKPEPVSLEDWLSYFTWPSLGQMQDSWEDIQSDYDERSRKQVRGAKVKTR
jgi:hypothetical protein